MSTTTNEAAALLLPVANDTTNPGAAISARILYLVTVEGMGLPEAMDAVLGAGTFAKVSAARGGK